ncbi:MAG: hypothetical protein AAFO07_29750 [Bacteroidota bacterium]
MKYLYLLILLFISSNLILAQPRQTDYFHKDKGSNWRSLAEEPGEYIMMNSILIGNYHPSQGIQFSLCWDECFKEGKTQQYRLQSSFASTYLMGENKGCYIRIRTKYKVESKEVIYFLEKAHCYAIYWNQEEARWDVQEALCKRY